MNHDYSHTFQIPGPSPADMTSLGQPEDAPSETRFSAMSVTPAPVLEEEKEGDCRCSQNERPRTAVEKPQSNMMLNGSKNNSRGLSDTRTNDSLPMPGFGPNSGGACHSPSNIEEESFPEGGVQAYMCVFGSFCGCMLSLGMVNSLAVFQSYITSHQLAGHPESSTGWIFGLYTCLSFFFGIQVGPIFDAKGPKWLVFSGSILILTSYLLLGICTTYWHFVIVFSILGGVGTSLVFTCSMAAVGHWFYHKRGQWTGLASVGGGLGGVMVPLILKALLPKIGWAWSTRALALVNLLFAVGANAFLRSRLRPRASSTRSLLPDPRIFQDRTFSLTATAVFFLDLGLFVPLGYLTSYAVQAGATQPFSYQLVAILNAGSCLGRYVPGYMADILGRFNALILSLTICLVSVFALWLPANGSLPMIIVFAVVFGFGSGSGISLVPVCIGQLCKTEHYGRYYATCCTVISFATLIGLPIAGAIIGACAGRYWGLICFTGASYAVSAVMLVCARVTKTGCRWKVKF